MDRARDHGLATVADLRGRFDADDVLATYRWQLDHLFPRCTHTLVAGLPPTRTVRADGVQWRELAREAERVRDSSNRQVRTFDLSAELTGEDGVYLRFQDSYGDDGWGASVGSVAVKADGQVVASFTPGTDAETPFLFDGVNSSMGGDANRFCDGGGYFIYRFTAPAGTRELVAEVDVWNQYLVTATTTAPTRIEPFPYFRDYAVASRAMVVWLPPSGGTGELLDEIFSRVEPTTPYAGWFSNDVAGEWGGVDRASQHGIEVVPADFYMNGTVHAGVPAKVSAEIRPRRRSTLRNRVYLTLTFGEGDNVQYCQRHMRDIWDDPKRGAVPVNWTVSPLLADIGPALLAYYQKSATGNDLLIAGPSGAGYTYAGSWPEKALDAYTALTGRFLRRTGLDLVYAYNPATRPATAGCLRRARRPLLPGPHAGARHHPVLGDGGSPDQARGAARDRQLLPAGKGGRVPGRAAQAHQGLGRRLTAVHRGCRERLELDPERCRGARRTARGPVRDRPR